MVSCKNHKMPLIFSLVLYSVFLMSWWLFVSFGQKSRLRVKSAQMLSRNYWEFNHAVLKTTSWSNFTGFLLKDRILLELLSFSVSVVSVWLSTVSLQNHGNALAEMQISRSCLVQSPAQKRSG